VPFRVTGEIFWYTLLLRPGKNADTTTLKRCVVKNDVTILRRKCVVWYVASMSQVFSYSLSLYTSRLVEPYRMFSALTHFDQLRFQALDVLFA